MIASKRLDHIKEYYFSRKLREVGKLIAEGKPVINLGIGSPDLTAPKSVEAALVKSMNLDGVHKYQSYQGIPELRKAIASFYEKQYNVKLDGINEVLPLLGSKEGIMHISMAFLNAGDKVLIPNPGYPTYTSVTNLVGAQPVFYDLDASLNWLPDLKALEAMDLNEVKLMWLCYPHMPTGAKASYEDLKHIVDFAKRHNILLVNDNPYSFILNDNPLSILSVEGAKEVALELNSLSKSFNMAGWRVGMVCGKSEFISNVLKVKSNMDSGMFLGLQKGAIEALNLDQEWFSSLNAIYEKRRKLVYKLAEKLGCDCSLNTSGLFVWAKIRAHINSEVFIDKLLYEHSIFITPGTVFGSKGEGYVRFSLCASEELINNAIERVS